MVKILGHRRALGRGSARPPWRRRTRRPGAAARSCARPPAARPRAPAASAPPALACLRKSATARARLALSSVAFGIGHGAEHPARAIFARRAPDRPRARQSRSRAGGTSSVCYPSSQLTSLGPKLGEVELVAHVAGQDQRALGAEQAAQPLLPARRHRNIARDERHQPVLRAHRLQRRAGDRLRVRPAAEQPSCRCRARRRAAARAATRRDRADRDQRGSAGAGRLGGQLGVSSMSLLHDSTIPRRSRSTRCAVTDPPAAGTSRGSSPG